MAASLRKCPRASTIVRGQLISHCHHQTAFENDVSAFSSADVRDIPAIDRARILSEKRGRKIISRRSFKTVAEMLGRSQKMGHI